MFLWGANEAGQIAGQYVDTSTGASYGFVGQHQLLRKTHTNQTERRRQTAPPSFCESAPAGCGRRGESAVGVETTPSPRQFRRDPLDLFCV
jgi:hypothetical protein